MDSKDDQKQSRDVVDADTANSGIDRSKAEEKLASVATEAALQSVDRKRIARDGDYKLAPRTVAAVASCVAIAALAALVIVASLEKANGLATVALSLAILTFVIQILLFIAQTNSTAQATLHSEELNTTTSGVLTEIRTTARDTQRMVGSQFADLLQAYTEIAALGSKVDQGQVANVLRDVLRREVPFTIRAPEQETALDALSAPISAGIRQLLEGYRARAREQATILETFPEQEQGREAVDTLKALSKPALKRLRALAEDVKQMGELGGLIGLLGSVSDPAGQELRGLGLTELFQGPSDPTRTWERLTEAGREVARVLTGTGERPEWAREVADLGFD